MKHILSMISLILACNKSLFALEQPFTPLLPKELIYNKQPIEAYCICELIQTTFSKFRPLDIKRCQEVIRIKDPLKEFDSEYFKGFSGYTYNYKAQDGLPVHESCYWKYLGSPLAGQLLIYSVYSGGGSGTFSDLSFVSRKGDFLYLERKIDGGDRAEGGITEPVLKGNKLMYKKAVTPAPDFRTLYSGEVK
ncbi:MAG: hypothetical protein K2X28_06260 [Alphaproteobacteria bacterium]|nr:hypothetical protein [Alphaproteobacteria bacterium]